MELIEALLSNSFVILMLLAGLFGLLGRNKSEDETDNRPTRRERAPQPINIPDERYEQARDQVRESVDQATEEIGWDSSNEWYDRIEETKRLRDESRARFKREASKVDPIKKSSLVMSDLTDDDQISIKQNFTSKRLIESFIMLEVLQKPKARQNLEK